MGMIGGSGMEGFIFFWLFWIFWVLSTFFMTKKEVRLQVSVWLLAAIALSTYSLTLFNIDISLTSLLIVLTTYFLMARETGRTGSYLFITSFIIMLVYSTFHLYELFDPVWLIFNRSIMLSLLIAYISSLLQSDFRQRVIILLAGSIHGDILYSFILGRFSFPYTIGSFAFLDVMAIAISILLVISGFKRLSLYFENHVKLQLEKEKQKQS
jgi:hypothetical protein